MRCISLVNKDLQTPNYSMGAHHYWEYIFMLQFQYTTSGLMILMRGNWTNFKAVLWYTCMYKCMYILLVPALTGKHTLYTHKKSSHAYPQLTSAFKKLFLVCALHRLFLSITIYQLNCYILWAYLCNQVKCKEDNSLSISVDSPSLQ